MQTSVLYYTNNLLPKKLFKHVLNNVIKHTQENNCELIVTSHFPITKQYEEISLNSKKSYGEDVRPDGEQERSKIYDYIVKDVVIEPNINYKSFVVGKIPYSLNSILKQIVLSLENASHENIVLMEHDCLYPNNYISTVNKALTDYQKDFTYTASQTIFLNTLGFF